MPKKVWAEVNAGVLIIVIINLLDGFPGFARIPKRKINQEF